MGGDKDQPLQASSKREWAISRGQAGLHFPGSANFGEGLGVKGREEKMQRARDVTLPCASDVPTSSPKF